MESKKSQAQAAYEALEEMIVTLKLKPGAKVSEKSLSEMLGIGRTPVREALQRLAMEGNVEIAPKSGIYISEIDVKDQFRLIEIRRFLERIMAERAAVLATEDEQSQFALLADEFMKAAETDDGDAFVTTDRKFNNLLASSARHKYAISTMSILQAQTRRFWYLYFKRFGDLGRVSRLHANIALAIASGNVKGAKKASDELINYVEEYTTKTLKVIS